MKPLRERNQATVGVVTVVLLTLAATVAFFSKDLPVIGSGTTYSAYFSESAGLVPGNDVQTAGIKVGEVTDVELDGNRVLVDFTVDDVRMGDRTTAAIEIKTLLGEKHLAVRPAGSGELDPDTPIPMSRTTSPFDIPDAINQLTRTAEKVDTKQLAHSFRVVSETFRNSPQHMGEAVNGLSRLSETIASRDEQLANLLKNAGGVSKIAADRDAQVRKLVEDGNLLLAELQQRREAISALLRGTQELSTQLRGLVADNREQLRPALAQLEQVTSMLQRNQDNIGRTVAAMAPYVRAFNNTIGTGRWFDGYICGFLPPTTNGGPIQINPKSCELPVTGPPRSGP